MFLSSTFLSALFAGLAIELPVEPACLVGQRLESGRIVPALVEFDIDQEYSPPLTWAPSHTLTQLAGTAAR